jgi:hypothetical protein
MRCGCGGRNDSDINHVGAGATLDVCQIWKAACYSFYASGTSMFVEILIGGCARQWQALPASYSASRSMSVFSASFKLGEARFVGQLNSLKKAEGHFIY